MADFLLIASYYLRVRFRARGDNDNLIFGALFIPQNLCQSE